MTNRSHFEQVTAHGTMTVMLRVACALLAWCMASAAHAAIYQCIDAHGRTAYRDTPCDPHARQTKLDVAGQPLIDANAPPQAPAPRVAGPRTSARRSASTRRATKPTTSWECRAADGEVFYRHTRCPGSVPGDGTVRGRYAETQSSERTRNRHDAWSRVRVHGVKIPRSEACLRIHAPSAAGRDGHARDANVATYDHLMGRDPCRGA